MIKVQMPVRQCAEKRILVGVSSSKCDLSLSRAMSMPTSGSEENFKGRRCVQKDKTGNERMTSGRRRPKSDVMRFTSIFRYSCPPRHALDPEGVVMPRGNLPCEEYRSNLLGRQGTDGKRTRRIFRAPMFSELEHMGDRSFELEVDVADDVLVSCAMSGKGRNTSTKLSEGAICMMNW